VPTDPITNEMVTSPAVHDTSIFEMATGSGPVVQFVLIVLLVLSIWSWAITFAKVLQFSRARKQSKEFNDLFWETRNFARVDDSSRRLSDSPLVRVFSSGYRELSHILQEGGKNINKEPSLMLATVEHALKRAGLDESARLERGITFLASVASAAPFIGLFGTVWGIMTAFNGLSKGGASTIQAVAPGISEALVATAIGLAAAIPAAIAYNFFVTSVKHFKQSMATFGDEFLDIAKQNFTK
jgi:biopolymer transport protein TolQ